MLQNLGTDDIEKFALPELEWNVSYKSRTTNSDEDNSDASSDSDEDVEFS